MNSCIGKHNDRRKRIYQVQQDAQHRKETCLGTGVVVEITD